MNDIEHSVPITESDSVGLCFVCKEIVYADTDPILAEEGYFHQECFVCSECFEPFVYGEYIEVDMHMFCDNCYESLYSYICVACDKPITDKLKRFQDLTWHHSCFVCSKCQEDLQQVDFCILYEKPFCLGCVPQTVQKNEIICEECNEPIKSDMFKHVNCYYHAWHFKCSLCKSDLDSDGSYKGHDFYCRRCFGSEIGNICHLCKEAIIEHSITISNKYYHPEHVLCAKCGICLKDRVRFELNDYSYCLMDYKQVCPNLCFICSNAIVGNFAELCGKKFCNNHFVCHFCGHKFEAKEKITDADLRPACNACWTFVSDSYKKSVKKAQIEEKRLKDLETAAAAAAAKLEVPQN